MLIWTSFPRLLVFSILEERVVENPPCRMSPVDLSLLLHVLECTFGRHLDIFFYWGCRLKDLGDELEFKLVNNQGSGSTVCKQFMRQIF